MKSGSGLAISRGRKLPHWQFPKAPIPPLQASTGQAGFLLGLGVLARKLMLVGVCPLRIQQPSATVENHQNQNQNQIANKA